MDSTTHAILETASHSAASSPTCRVAGRRLQCHIKAACRVAGRRLQWHIKGLGGHSVMKQLIDCCAPCRSVISLRINDLSNFHIFLTTYSVQQHCTNQHDFLINIFCYWTYMAYTTYLFNNILGHGFYWTNATIQRWEQVDRDMGWIVHPKQ